jgi:hypothetical protein
LLFFQKKNAKNRKTLKKTLPKNSKKNRKFKNIMWNEMELFGIKTNENDKECSRSVPMGIGWK